MIWITAHNRLENKQKLLVFFSFCVYLIFDTCTLLEPPFTEGIKITLEIYKYKHYNLRWGTGNLPHCNHTYNYV